MNIKTQIKASQNDLLKKWSTLCILILICVSPKFQAVYNEVETGSDPQENTLYVTKGTVIYNQDPNIRIKEIPEVVKKERTGTKSSRKRRPESTGSSEKKEPKKAEQIRNVPILYSKNPTSGNGLSVQGRNEIVFVSVTGDIQIKSAVQKYIENLYVSGDLHTAKTVRRRFENLFLQHHFSESHAIRPPPVFY